MKKLIFCSLVLLCACAPRQPVDYTALDKQQCQTYGFKAKTDAFANCMMQQASLRTQEASANQRTASSNSLQQQQYWQNMMQAGTPQTRGTNCTTNYFGGTASTNCY